VTDHALSRDELAQWTPYKRDWHRRKFPSNWAEIESRLELTEIILGLRSEPVLDWNAARHGVAAELRVVPPQPESELEPTERVHGSEVIKVCADVARARITEITGPRRVRSLVYPRMVAAYVMATHCDHLSLPQIGRLLGGRDHSTVIHAKDKVRADLANGGERFGEIVAAVETRLGLR
jgi:hypothetical protein